VGADGGHDSIAAHSSAKPGNASGFGASPACDVEPRRRGAPAFERSAELATLPPLRVPIALDSPRSPAGVMHIHRYTAALILVLAAALSPACDEGSRATEERDTATVPSDTDADVAEDAPDTSASDTAAPDTADPDQIDRDGDVGEADIADDTRTDAPQDTSPAGDGDAQATDVPPGCTTLPFRTIETWRPHVVMDRLQSEVQFFRAFATADAYRNVLGVDPPADIDFGVEWAAVGQFAPSFSYPRAVSEIYHCPDDDFVHVRFESRSTSNCEPPVPRWSWHQFILVAVEADAEVPLDGFVGDPADFVTPPFDCETEGELVASACTLATLCAPGATCGGLTRGLEGICIPLEQVETFTSEQATSIPDGDPTGVELVRSVAGLAGLDIDVVVRARITHPDITEVAVDLVSPSGREVSVCAVGQCPERIARAPDGFIGENVGGDWTLRVTVFVRRR